MSLTKDSRLRRFFTRRIVPTAERIRRRGVTFFPLGPEPEQDTWYVEAPSGDDFVDFDAGGPQRALYSLWQEQGLAELAELVAPLMEIAEHLKVLERDSADEVSPFIYVMY
jgi:hypothetical protein